MDPFSLKPQLPSRQLSLKKKNPQITNDGESVERQEPSYAVGRNVNWFNHYEELYEGFLKN